MVPDLDLVSFLLNLIQELRLSITMTLMVEINKDKIGQELVITFLYLEFYSKLGSHDLL